MTWRAMLMGTAKPKTLAAAGFGGDPGVDADEPAFGIHERAAGIALVDRGVGLDEILIAAHFLVVTAQAADNAHRHRLSDAEGISDGENNVAHFQLVAVAKRDGGQIGRVNLQNRDVGLRIRADDFGGVFFFAVVTEGHLDFLLAAHDVVGGEDVAVRRNDDAGAEDLFLLGQFTAVLLGLIPEKLAEKRVVAKRIAPARRWIIRVV